MEDPFVDAKSNIRDTVKWMATAFAALAAVVIGSSPLSGLGKVPFASPPFWAAALLLLTAFGCICFALLRVLGILASEALYRSDLLDASPPKTPEVARLRKMIEEHKADMLPCNYSLVELGKAIEETTNALERNPSNDVLKGKLQKLALEASKIMVHAKYLMLQSRLQRAIPWVFGWGIGALVCLTAYGVIVAQAADSKSDPPIAIMNKSSDRGR